MSKATTDAYLRANIDIGGDDCWLWRNPDGQGYGPYRRAYKHWVGAIPPGLVIDHVCRQKACINPRHLEAVTQGENLYRATPYRRQQRLDSHPVARLILPHLARLVDDDGHERCGNWHQLTPTTTRWNNSRGATHLICKDCERERWARFADITRAA